MKFWGVQNRKIDERRYSFFPITTILQLRRQLLDGRPLTLLETNGRRTKLSLIFAHRTYQPWWAASPAAALLGMAVAFDSCEEERVSRCFQSNEHCVS